MPELLQEKDLLLDGGKFIARDVVKVYPLHCQQFARVDVEPHVHFSCGALPNAASKAVAELAVARWRRG